MGLSIDWSLIYWYRNSGWDESERVIELHTHARTQYPSSVFQTSRTSLNHRKLVNTMHVCSDINIYSGQYLVWLTMINCRMVSQCSWTIFTLHCTVWSCIFFFLKVWIAIVLGHIIYKSKVPISFVLFEHLAIVSMQDNMKWKWVKYHSLRQVHAIWRQWLKEKRGKQILAHCWNIWTR